jgi:hypothetical protein
METLIPLFGIIAMALFGAPIVYDMGRRSKEEPSESEMIRRIVNMRTKRRVGMITEHELDKELNGVADRLAERANRA